MWLIGPDDGAITRLRQQVNKFFNPKHEITLYQNGYKISGNVLHTPRYGNAIRVLNDKMCRFMISLFCSKPLFTTEESRSIVVASWEKEFKFPLEFPYPDETYIFGVRRPSFIVDVENEGHEPCGMIITFIANGEVHMPRVTNIETQEFIELNIVLQDGEKAIVDTSGRITRVMLHRMDGEIINILNTLTNVSSQNMKLPIGKSSMTYSANQNSENLSLLIGYSPLFLEVL